MSLNYLCPDNFLSEVIRIKVLAYQIQEPNFISLQYFVFLFLVFSTYLNVFFLQTKNKDPCSCYNAGCTSRGNSI